MTFRININKRREWKPAVVTFAAMAILGALMVAGGCSWKETPGGSASTKPLAASGNTAIDFAASDLSGKNVKLSDLKGKIVLVNFWAVWCGPCQMEIPELVDLYTTYHDKGFVVLGVSDSSDLAEIKRFVQEHKMDYPVVVDPGSISEEYNVVGFPTSFLIDRSGAIVQKFNGYSPNLRKKLETQIQKLM